LLIDEFAEIGTTGDADLDPADVVFFAEGFDASGALGEPLNEDETDTLGNCRFAMRFDSGADVSVEVGVWILFRSGISRSFQGEFDNVLGGGVGRIPRMFLYAIRLIHGISTRSISSDKSTVGD
jgi:hypothetical protein